MKTHNPHNPHNSPDSHKLKRVLTLSTIVGITALFVGLTNKTSAQIVTNLDTANNYSTLTWTNGANAGNGFGAWNLFTSGSAGFFIGSSATQGFGDIDTSGSSFGMFGNPSGDNYANAERSFSSALNVGDSFSVDLAIAFRNGNKGISLFSGGFAPANELWNFNVGSDLYAAGGTDLGWTYSQTSIFNLLATQSATDTLTISLVRGADTYTTNITTLGGLSGFRMYVGSTEAGNDLNNLFANNLQTTIVPEPSTYTLLTLCAIALGAHTYRRRQRTRIVFKNYNNIG
jgi:hypothetical protein